ncbi:MAG: type II toxin-antitoxin system HicB family antitoxin [Nitrospirae bacterium]|nr:type II toxin-antitoxin system HicB family antitoxin [Nitrospirota bacterium]
MKFYIVIIEKYHDRGLSVNYIPDNACAHSQAGTLEKLNINLKEVIEMLRKDGIPTLEYEYVGTQNIV